jgi:hypothetical protein
MAINQSEIDSFTEQLKYFYKDSHLVTDGILNVDLYNLAKYKILWILKEPYGNGDMDYSEYIEESFKFKGKFHSAPKMWERIIYTNYGILNNFEKWDDMDWLNKDENVFNSLKYCALINLKKVPGKTRSNYYEIQEHYNRSKEIIKKQLSLINPEIIICGGTFKLIKEDFGIGHPLVPNNDFGYLLGNQLFINAYHPSYFFGGEDFGERYCDKIIDCCKTWANNKIKSF